jgi:peptidoglycan/xylan/chitin deacetylase (PgdA/CDA1 family)
MYHSLSDGRHPDALYPKYTTTLARFREHLRALQDAGFALLDCRALLAGSLPEKACVLTFDDGHKSTLDLCDALAEAKAPGTFFLTSGYCRERPDFLKPDDLCALAAAGFDFGAHGATHRPLADIPAHEMERELRESKAWCEDALGRPVETMSLPAGRGSPAVNRAAFAAGYRLIGTSREAANRTLTIPGILNRCVVLAGHTAADVVKIAQASPAYLLRRRLRAAALWLPKKILRPHHLTRN